MIRYVIDRFGMIAFLVIVIACNANNGRTTDNNNTDQKPPRNDTLKIQGCQDNIKAELGSVIEIRLEATPATGYQWLLKEPSQIVRLLDPDSLKFSTPETKEPVPGQPGHQILHFKAIKKGEETIQLDYKRV